MSISNGGCCWLSSEYSRYRDYHAVVYSDGCDIVKGKGKICLCRPRGGGGSIDPTHLHLGLRRKWVVSTTLPPLPLEGPSIPCIGCWLGLGAGLEARNISPPTGIRSPDRPVRRESQYLLSYPGPLLKYTSYTI